MILSPPVAWRFVPVGAVVFMDRDPVPRRLEHADAQLHHGRRVVFLEGLTAPMVVDPGSTVRLVALDFGDAVAALRAAGLTAEPVEPAG